MKWIGEDQGSKQSWNAPNPLLLIETSCCSPTLITCTSEFDLADPQKTKGMSPPGHSKPLHSTIYVYPTLQAKPSTGKILSDMFHSDVTLILVLCALKASRDESTEITYVRWVKEMRIFSFAMSIDAAHVLSNVVTCLLPILAHKYR